MAVGIEAKGGITMKNMVLYSLFTVLVCLMFVLPNKAFSQCGCWFSGIENAVSDDPIISCNVSESSATLIVDKGIISGCKNTLTLRANSDSCGVSNNSSPVEPGVACASVGLGGIDPEGICIADLEDFCASLDTDGDGIPNEDDLCPDSILDETIIIDGCDSGVENLLLEDGCTISDLIVEIADEAKNHGKFVSGVAHLLKGLKKDGLISGKEKGAIQSCAAQSDIP